MSEWVSTPAGPETRANDAASAGTTGSLETARQDRRLSPWQRLPIASGGAALARLTAGQ